MIKSYIKIKQELPSVLKLHKEFVESCGEKGEKAYLSKHLLSCSNLPQADLRKANLYKVDLSFSNLINSDFSEANLEFARLTGADFLESTFKKTNLFSADLRNANLWGADFYKSELSKSNLEYANLRGADFTSATCIFTDFYNTDLTGANFHNANLENADLRYADLTGADLRGANLAGAELEGAKFDNIIWDLETTGLLPVCPTEGSFVGYKKIKNQIIKLFIPADAERSSATTRRCKCDKALVLSIENIDGTDSEIKEIFSNYNKKIIYKKGEITMIDNFNKDRWNEGLNEICFYMTRKEAETNEETSTC